MARDRGITFIGDDQDDRVDGLDGRDFLSGRGGNDRLRGNDGDDILRGDGGDDRLFGNNGDDRLSGGTGDDVLRGGRGDDRIFGDHGDDDLDGGGGDDVLRGGLGQDTITTGGGRDEIIFAENALNRLDPDPGQRSVIGGEDIVTDFNQARDTFILDAEAFGVRGPLTFANALAEDLAAVGANVIVLQNADDDGNPDTVFNAGSAANLIAAQVEQPGAGFFVYFNSALEVNRLVYSDDLSNPTSDLQIVAALTDVEGDAAIDALAGFRDANFQFRNEQPTLEEAVEAGDAIVGTDGPDVFAFEGTFFDNAFVDVDQDLRFFTEDKTDIVGFDVAEDTIKLDGRPLGDEGVDELVFDGDGQNVFLLTEGRPPLSDFTADLTALRIVRAETTDGDGDPDAGFFVYYDRRDDLVKFAAYENLDDPDALNAGVIAEVDVGGEADGLAFIASLSEDNFDLFA